MATDKQVAWTESEGVAALLDAFLERAPIGLAFIDRDLRYRRINRLLAEIDGLPPDQCLGRAVQEVVPQLWSTVEPLYKRVLERGEVIGNIRISGETFAQPGRKRDWVVSYFPVEARAERIGVGVVVLEVTEQREAELALMRSEERFRTFFEHAAMGMVLADPITGRFFAVNTKYREITGYSEEELLKMTFRDVTHPDDREIDFDNWKKMVRGEIPVYSIEKRYVRKDSGILWVRVGVTAFRSPSGAPLHTIAVIEDITSRKEAEILLQKSEAALSESLKALRHSNEELERFASVASHDLKEPLRTVKNFLAMLSKSSGGKLSGTELSYISFAVDGANRMYELVDALLDYSKIGRAATRLERVDCGSVLQEALSNLEAAMIESGAEITSDPLPMAVGDRMQLLQLFQNLLSNAIKYRGERKPVIRVTSQPKGEFWIFRIHDNGIGIPEDQTENIFKSFHRLHARSEYSGTGLGLAVCKRIVELHGGNIWVESKPTEGSVFYFTLMAAK